MDLQIRHQSLFGTLSIRPSVASRWAQTGLILSLLLMALTPVAVADSYSILENTLSESGGQGVAGAWVFRSAVLVASASVLVLTSVSRPLWSDWTRRWFHLYSLALVMLVVFPESSWEQTANDQTVAFLHTASGVTAAVAFCCGAYLLSPSRRRSTDRALDWIAIVSVAVIPQAMLLASYPGLLQRLMVGIGYAWLIAESGRISSYHRRAGLEPGAHPGPSSPIHNRA